MGSQQTKVLEKDIGCLFIVAAPSGGGKTSLVHQLVQDVDKIQISISHTTRQKRPGEEDGVHYFFVEDTDFEQMIKNHEFIEYARVFDHLYGTSVKQINQRLQQGIDIVLDIDWQGAQQIKHLYPDAVSIFVLPPSLEVLHERLKNRQQDTDHVILNRMLRAQDEMNHYHEFDYLIINDDFAKAAFELTVIVRAERLKMLRQQVRQRHLLTCLMTSY